MVNFFTMERVKFLLILLMHFHVSLAYMAVDMTTAVYSCNLILSPRELDFHMLSILLKTVAALLVEYSPLLNVSILRYDAIKICEVVYTF